MEYFDYKALEDRTYDFRRRAKDGNYVVEAHQHENRLMRATMGDDLDD